MKYVLKHFPFHAIPYDFRFSVEERIKKHQEEIEQKARTAKAEMEKNVLFAEAIIWLQSRGKVLGTDFTAENAIAVADEIAAGEEISKQKAILLGNDCHINFDGQNCDEPCAGWDGNSRRCQCGNRRVCWSYGYGHSFKTPSIYGEAY